MTNLSGSCIHIINALLHWDHTEEALFSFEEPEREAKRFGFRTANEAIKFGMLFHDVKLFIRQFAGFVQDRIWDFYLFFWMILFRDDLM